MVVPEGGTGGRGRLPQEFEFEVHQVVWVGDDLRRVCEGVIEGWQEHEGVAES